MQAPSNGGSYYYNYKGSHSTVLMAVVDAQYHLSMLMLVSCYHEYCEHNYYVVCLGDAG